MRIHLLAVLLVPTALTAQGGRSGRAMPNGFGGGALMPSVPQQIVAPEVPVMDGLPHAVRIGYTVYLAGMVPLDSAGRLVGGDDLAAQTRQVFANIGAVMRAAHGVAGDVVHLTIYVRDLTPEKAITAQRALLDAVDHTAPPAVTIVGAPALPDPAMLVMIDGTAELRSDFPDRNRSSRP